MHTNYNLLILYIYIRPKIYNLLSLDIKHIVTLLRLLKKINIIWLLQEQNLDIQSMPFIRLTLKLAQSESYKRMISKVDKKKNENNFSKLIINYVLLHILILLNFLKNVLILFYFFQQFRQ